MYSVGLFYAWDFFWWIVVTIAYIYAPASILRVKNEYISFFLIFFSLVFTLFVFVINATRNTELTHMVFLTTVFPLLFVFHLIFPFRKTQKSQHLSFFLFFIAAYMLALRGTILLAFAISNM
jgi:hypothetical protein